MSELARRYGQALCEAVPSGEDLEATARAVMGDAALWEALCSPAVRAGEKARILDRLPALRGRDALRNFYRLLAEKGRMALLPDILEACRDQALARRGAVRCRLTCVRPPDGAELERLRRALCRLHHREDVVFDVRTDPSLLGGFTLELEGVTYDKSARGALAGLTRRLEERRGA